MSIKSVCVQCLTVLCMWCAGCEAKSESYNALAMERDSLAPQLAEAAAQATPKAELPVAEKSAAVPAVQRTIIYSGLMQLVVADVGRTLEAIRSQALGVGGYLQEMDGGSITVRVPAARFTEIVSGVSKLGEVVGRQIKSQDITEEMRNLRIRLQNAEEMRKRLLAHLEKTGKIEDTLKIEVELERITQTIELLKGKIQLLESQVAYSVLKVTVNSPLPQKQLVAQIPFDWVRHLGEGVVSGVAASDAHTSSRERREIRFDVPKSYIRYHDREEMTEAMSADGVLIKIHKHDNYKGGDLEFWSGLARRVLVEQRSVAFDAERTIQVDDKLPARLLIGSRDLAGQKSGYLLAIAVIDSKVYAYEAWGPLAAFDKDKSAIEASIKSLKPRD